MSPAPSPKPRPRIDWMPGDAALQALAQAQRTMPAYSRQALIDLLVVNGLWALQFRPPALPGRDRDRWRLPDLLQAARDR
ncbi:MAG: hypothetical protein QM750_11765 [Rubrivivax sp.]